MLSRTVYLVTSLLTTVVFQYDFDVSLDVFLIAAVLLTLVVRQGQFTLYLTVTASYTSLQVSVVLTVLLIAVTTRFVVHSVAIRHILHLKVVLAWTNYVDCHSIFIACKLQAASLTDCLASN